MKSLKSHIGQTKSPSTNQKKLSLNKLKSTSSRRSKTPEGVTVNVAAAFGSNATSGKLINLKILLKCTNEKFNVSNFPVALKVRDLKGLLEFICGIPYNLQRLSYLDDGRLFCFLVLGGTPNPKNKVGPFKGVFMSNYSCKLVRTPEAQDSVAQAFF